MSIAEQPVVRKSVLRDMADRYGMEHDAFERVICATVMPRDATKEQLAAQLAAFLLVAKEYNLNPLTKEIYAFATKSGGIQPIVGIDGWINLANSHPMYYGMEFEDHLNGNGGIPPFATPSGIPSSHRCITLFNLFDRNLG